MLRDAARFELLVRTHRTGIATHHHDWQLGFEEGLRAANELVREARIPGVRNRDRGHIALFLDGVAKGYGRAMLDQLLVDLARQIPEGSE